MEYNLLEKTEVWVTGLGLQAVNLTELARAAAQALGLEASEVMVVDVRQDLVTFDILRQTVRAEAVAGKKAQLLQAIAAVPGVTLTEKTAVHSDGVLGVIALEPDEAAEVLERTHQMTESILRAVARRAIVFASGFEVSHGLIEDTNSPYLKSELEAHGFRAALGPVLEDDLRDVAFNFRDAVNQGYGLVISTGGVGAESKDATVEGLLQVAPNAATPWLVMYEKGQGRHVKEGVRIAVGRVGPTTLIALPGPNDEVRIALPVILQHCENGSPEPQRLAEDIAQALRRRLAEKMGQGKIHPDHRHNPEGKP
jgi:molybdenum cofactor synthesis domain-containing protein